MPGHLREGLFLFRSLQRQPAFLPNLPVTPCGHRSDVTQDRASDTRVAPGASSCSARSQPRSPRERVPASHRPGKVRPPCSLVVASPPASPGAATWRGKRDVFCSKGSAFPRFAGWKTFCWIRGMLNPIESVTGERACPPKMTQGVSNTGKAKVLSACCLRRTVTSD